MNHDRDEALSRLLAGDLSDEEAAVWRDRIAADPEVARAWSAMQVLAGDLDDWPLDAPPAHLDAAVLDRPARLRIVPWLAAALVLFGVGWLAWPAPAPTVTLGLGTHTVDGDLRVVAGDVVVDVDGTARIAIGEPLDPPARGPGAQEDEMNPVVSALVGAVGGAVVTVAVLKGTADVRSGPEAHLSEGEAITIPGEGPPRRIVRRVPAPDAAPARPATVVRDLATAQTRIAELEAENEDLRRDLGMASGQLSTLTGEPQAWPDDLPEAFQPDAMRARFEEVFARYGDQMVLADIDCSEYPCIALAEAPPGQRLPEGDELKDLTSAFTEGLEDSALMVSRSQRDHDGEVVDAMGVALMPEQPDPEQAPRTDYRLRTLMESVATP